tara:strand:- start:53 stop:391 length:339 start_codon:yes stop_codon:yes gene_type:complete
MSRLLTLLAAASLTAVPLEAEVRTVTGELVEMSCYARNQSSGTGHAACALKCAQGGAEVGILTDEGVLSVSGELAGTSTLLALLAETVTATGDVMEKDGKLWINIQTIDLAK